MGNGERMLNVGHRHSVRLRRRGMHIRYVWYMERSIVDAVRITYNSSVMVLFSDGEIKEYCKETRLPHSG